MKRWIVVALASLFLNINTGFLAVWAQTPDYQSSNFGIDEFFIGGGGEIDATSGSYSLRGSIGDTGIGNSSSANFQLWGGYTTTSEPFLELAVNTSAVDLGVIDSSTTGTGTASFQVRNYLSEGYVVSSHGSTLTNSNGDTLDGMSTRGSSTQGTEQFGFNLRENANPAVFGAEIEQYPDSSFSFGVVSSDYNVVDEYKFLDADIIASSASSSGRSIYTIAYIANAGFISGAGLYQMNHSIVATSTY